MKAKIIIITSLICLLVAVGVIAIVLFKQSSDTIMRLAVYSQENRGNTYYFSLSDDAVLRVSLGERRYEDITSNRFMLRSRVSSKVELSEDDFTIIVHLLNELESSEESGQSVVFYGGIAIKVLYNDEVYFSPYRGLDSSFSSRLVAEMSRLSPIPVELRGFA